MPNSSMLVPGDFDTEAAGITRKRAVLEAMLKQNMTPAQGQMVSGHYVAPNWAEHLATLATAIGGERTNQKLDEQTSDMNQRYQSGLGDAVQNYLTQRNGETKAVDNQGPMQDGSAMTGQHVEQTAADPRGAIVNAMTSQYKPLQQLGAAELGALGKSSMTPKDILALSGYSPASKVAAALSGDTSLLKSEKKQHVVNGQLVTADDEAPAKVAFDGRDKFDNPENIQAGPDGKPLVGQREKGTNHVTWAPVGTTVNVDTAEKGGTEFAKAIGKKNADNLQTSFEGAQKAQQSFEVYKNAKGLVAQVPGGTGADAILGAKKIASLLGVPMGNEVTSMEQVVAALGQGVLDNSKLLGSGNGFTDKDREFLQNIVLGKASLDHATLERAVDLGLAGSYNAMRSHEDLLKKLSGASGADESQLAGFQVNLPTLGESKVFTGDRFDYSPTTRRFTVKTASGQPNAATGNPAAPRAGNTAPAPTAAPAYTDAMEARRQQLIKQLGVQQ